MTQSMTRSGRAIYDAVPSQLPGATFLDLLRFPHEMIRAVATGLNRSLRRSTQVVGGGTLVGQRHSRQYIFIGRKSSSHKDD
jgi:hypothetical protein